MGYEHQVRVLVVNAGSSSLKLRIVSPDDTVERADNLPAPDESENRELVEFLAGAGPVDAVAHRVVHGGDTFTESAVVDASSWDKLSALDDLAPLHNPPARRGIAVMRRLLPDVGQVLCFDTTFHRWMPDEATVYALPARWREAGVRRFGFHGLSYAWAAERGRHMLGTPGAGSAEQRLVVCHLGSGASVAAIAGGRSLDTTMGFTPTEGLVMATRAGDVDPGALVWIQRRFRLGPAGMERDLEHSSGLYALAGTGDMKELLSRRAAGDADSGEAIAVYTHRLRAKIAAMAAALGGLDALVFTGGVGERAAPIRAETCDRLAWMGVALDPESNAAVGEDDADLSAAGSSVRTLVIHAREDVIAAREARRLL